MINPQRLQRATKQLRGEFYNLQLCKPLLNQEQRRYKHPHLLHLGDVRELGFSYIRSISNMSPLPCWTIYTPEGADYREGFCPAQDPGLTGRCYGEDGSQTVCRPDCSDVPAH